jgi:maltooligosyltrehalose trehalohydrolase
VDGLLHELRRDRAERFVAAAQNHDQVGNRAFGDRLPPDAHRVALACVLFSLHTPLVFMGEEYEEQRPFQFFTDHIDPAIAEATSEGRRAEVERTSGSGGDAPDPQAVETFERSRLAPREPDPFFRELLALRPRLPRRLDVEADGERVVMRRGTTELVLDLAAKTAELRA